MPKTPLMKKGSACHTMGLGFDSHAFGKGGALVLGGVRFDGLPALKGHSDGDALLHAVIDALLGGAGQGDIGTLFPDSSSKWKNADSCRLLDKVVRKIHAKGLRAQHIDITIVADKPRLGPAKGKIQKTVAGFLNIDSTQVNIKAKTQEGLAWFKAPGGIAVWALATLHKK